MAGSLADYAANKILELIVGKTGFTTPTCYIKLCTTDPTNSVAGTECAGTGSPPYARKSTSGSDWGTASGRAITNAAAFEWTVNAGDWGTICAFELMDNSSGGNRLAWGTLAVDRSPISGDTLRFAIGDLDASVT